MQKNEVYQTLQGLSVCVAALAREMGLTRQAFRHRYNRPVLVHKYTKELVSALDRHIYGLMLYRDLLLERAYQDALDLAKESGKIVSDEGEA